MPPDKFRNDPAVRKILSIEMIHNIQHILPRTLRHYNLYVWTSFEHNSTFTDGRIHSTSVS